MSQRRPFNLSIMIMYPRLHLEVELLRQYIIKWMELVEIPILTKIMVDFVRCTHHIPISMVQLEHLPQRDIIHLAHPQCIQWMSIIDLMEQEEIHMLCKIIIIQLYFDYS